jgi:hypothetical protein
VVFEALFDLFFGNILAFSKTNAIFNDILQLPDIPRPGVTEHQLLGSWSESQNILSKAFVVDLEEEVDSWS